MAYDFNTIATNYDRLNHLMSLGLDRRWRSQATQKLSNHAIKPQTVLDVACGTGDMVVELLKHGFQVTGVDISEEMLSIARKKTASGSSSPTFLLADAEQLPFAENSFDAVTCAFGVRNFIHLEQGLQEMCRVMKPGGIAAILELSIPNNSFVLPFYNLYTRHIIPLLGAKVAGNREAYTYLPNSIQRFQTPSNFANSLIKAGFSAVHFNTITFGVCNLYVGYKTV